MDIYFDFELFEDEIINGHLFEILLESRKSVLNRLSPLKKELESSKLIVLIISKPGHNGLELINIKSGDQYFDEINNLLNGFSMADIFQQVLRVEGN